MLARIKRSRVTRTAIALQERYDRDSGGNMAAAIAFFGFLSLFPLVLLGLSILGFVLAGNQTLRQGWTDEVTRAVPGLETLIGDNIRALIRARRGAGVLALAGLLWTGTRVVNAAETGLGRIFGVRDQLGFLKENARRVGVTVGLGVVALAGTGVTALAGSLEAGGAVGVAVGIAATLVGLGIDFLLFIATYRVLIRRPGPAWAELWPGALLAAVGWTALKFLGAWYASLTTRNASAVYGTFTATVGVLVVLYLAARVFVYGAELIAVLREGEGGGGGDVEHDNARTGEGGGMSDAPGARPGDRSTIALVSQVAGDVGTLVKKEIELARQEIMEGVAARVKAGVALGAVAVLGLFALGFGAAAGASALDAVLPGWASRLVVAGAFLLLAGIAALFGLRRLKRPPLAPVKTKETLKEDVEWAKAQLKR